MGSTFHSVHLHVIFTCKDRQPLITPEIQQRLHPYIHGIVRRKGCTLVEGGGVADHVHLLLALSTTQSIADLLRDIKASSSKWIHDTWPAQEFGWQDGYGAFSVSVSLVEKTRAYIRSQEAHHKQVTFAEELKRFAEMHGMTIGEDGSVTAPNPGPDLKLPAALDDSVAPVGA